MIAAGSCGAPYSFTQKPDYGVVGRVLEECFQLLFDRDSDNNLDILYLSLNSYVSV